VLIRWALQRGTSVLPKSVNAERIAANLASANLVLTDEDFHRLSSLPTQVAKMTGNFTYAHMYTAARKLMKRASCPLSLAVVLLA